MTRFEIEFSYNEPRWGTIEIEAATKEDAEVEAENHIALSYPEAVDVSIDSVVEFEVQA